MLDHRLFVFKTALEIVKLKTILKETFKTTLFRAILKTRQGSWGRMSFGGKDDLVKVASLRPLALVSFPRLIASFLASLFQRNVTMDVTMNVTMNVTIRNRMSGSSFQLKTAGCIDFLTHSKKGLLFKTPVACEETAYRHPQCNLIRFAACRIELGLSNGKGIRAEMNGGAIITYRVATSTPASPAVETNVKKPNEDWKPTKSILRRKVNRYEDVKQLHNRRKP